MQADTNNNKENQTAVNVSTEDISGGNSSNLTEEADNSPESEENTITILSDFVLLQDGCPVDSTGTTYRQYVRYSTKLGGHTVLLFDSLQSEQWPAVLAELGPGACRLYLHTGESMSQPPAGALDEIGLLLAIWDDPDAMRLADCWPSADVADLAPLPPPTANLANVASATALTLLSPGADRIRLAGRLAEAGARAYDLWAVTAATLLPLSAPLVQKQQNQHQVTNKKEDDAEKDTVTVLSKRPCLSIPIDQPLWQVTPGQQPYLRIVGLRLSADSEQLACLTIHRLSPLILTAYTILSVEPEWGKVILCVLDPAATVEAIEAAAPSLIEFYRCQNLLDREKRPVKITIVRPETFEADGYASRSPDSFGCSFLPLITTAGPEFQPVFLMIWNLPLNMEPNTIVHRAHRFLPMVRSFYCPRLSPAIAGSDLQYRNCGFLIARFDKSTDCQHAMGVLKAAACQILVAIFHWSLVRFTFAHLQEAWQVTPMFTFPCHNLLPWLTDANQHSENPLDVQIDFCGSGSPFMCPCHPAAVPSAPAGGMFDWLATRLRQELPVVGDSVQALRHLSDLLKTSEEVVPVEVTAAWLSSPDSSVTGPVSRYDNAELLNALDHDYRDFDRSESAESNNAADVQWCLCRPQSALRSWRLLGLPIEMDAAALLDAIRVTFTNKLTANLYLTRHASGSSRLAILRLPVSVSRRWAEAGTERLAHSLPGSPQLRLKKWGDESLRLAGLRPGLAPFCPVPDACSARCQFILVWNIHASLTSADIARRFLGRFSQIRSVFAPTASDFGATESTGRGNLGYCVLRFDRTIDCARTLAALRSMAEKSPRQLAELCPIEKAYFTLCRMDDLCYMRPFVFPCHNILPWRTRRSSHQSHRVRLRLESWRQPFRCVCHPGCESMSPASVAQLGRLGRLIRTARSVCNCCPVGLRAALCEFLMASEDAEEDNDNDEEGAPPQPRVNDGIADIAPDDAAAAEAAETPGAS